jgi:hypothetical protein
MFATINFCVSGNNMSRAHHTCSVTSEMAHAIERRIKENGSYNFTLANGTEINQVIICEYTKQPKCMMNHFGFLTQLIGVSL